MQEVDDADVERGRDRDGRSALGQRACEVERSRTVVEAAVDVGTRDGDEAGRLDPRRHALDEADRQIARRRLRPRCGTTSERLAVCRAAEVLEAAVHLQRRDAMSRGRAAPPGAVRRRGWRPSTARPRHPPTWPRGAPWRWHPRSRPTAAHRQRRPTRAAAGSRSRHPRSGGCRPVLPSSTADSAGSMPTRWTSGMCARSARVVPRKAPAVPT